MDLNARSEYFSLPGYLATLRDLSKYAASAQRGRTAFNALDIFDARTAEEFLDAPSRAIAVSVRKRDFRHHDFAEMAMLFAVLAVHADREMRAAEAELAPKPTTTYKEEENGEDSIPF